MAEGEQANKKVSVLVTLSLIVVQLNRAAVTLSYKLAAAAGFSLRVIVAYLCTFTAGSLLLFSLLEYTYQRFLKKKTEEIEEGEERKKPHRPLTWRVVGLGLCCGLLSGAISNNLYAVSLKYVSATTAAAVTNTLPAVTFVLAVIFRKERLEFDNWLGRAKLLGTVVTVGGAMVLNFYKGRAFHFTVGHPLFPDSQPVDSKADRMAIKSHKHNNILGFVIAFLSCVSSASSLLLQEQMLDQYPHTFRVPTIISVLSAVTSIAFAGIMDRNRLQWKLYMTQQTAILIYCGLVSSGLLAILRVWCISKKGSFFVSVFSPVTLITVAIFTPLVWREPLTLGSIIGGAIVVTGVYLVIWGTTEKKKGDSPEDIEANHGATDATPTVAAEHPQEPAPEHEEPAAVGLDGEGPAVVEPEGEDIEANRGATTLHQLLQPSTHRNLCPSMKNQQLLGLRWTE